MSAWRRFVRKFNPFKGEKYVSDHYQDATTSGKTGKDLEKRPYMRKRAAAFRWPQNEIQNALKKCSRALQTFREKTGHYPGKGQDVEVKFRDGSTAIYEIEGRKETPGKIDKFVFDCRLVRPLEDDDSSKEFPKNIYVGSRTGIFKET